MPRQFATTCTLAITLLCGIPVSVSADNAIELPVLAAVRQNNLGVFEIMMMWWDKKPEPNPVQLQWLLAGVRLGNDHLPMRSNVHLRSNIAEPSQYKGSPIDLLAAMDQAQAPRWPWGSLPCSRGITFSGASP
jgi:hypothetical protein